MPYNAFKPKVVIYRKKITRNISIVLRIDATKYLLILFNSCYSKNIKRFRDTDLFYSALKTETSLKRSLIGK